MLKIGKYHKVVCQSESNWPTYHVLNLQQAPSFLRDGDVVILLDYKEFKNDPRKTATDQPVVRYKVLNSFGATSYIYSPINITSSLYRLEAVDPQEK